MRTKTSFILAVIFIMATGAVFAETPREQLKQMIEQLQKSPTDNALREQIIKLAQELKPAPAIPSEVLRHENTGHALFKKAKTRQDFLAAAHEYEQALRLAPWAAHLYFELGEAYENMGVAAVADMVSSAQVRQSCSAETYDEERQRFDGYELARKNFEFYLLSKVNITEQDAGMIKRRIAERELSFEIWRYQWNAECCAGCGGKQDSIK